VSVSIASAIRSLDKAIKDHQHSTWALAKAATALHKILGDSEKFIAHCRARYGFTPQYTKAYLLILVDMYKMEPRRVVWKNLGDINLQRVFEMPKADRTRFTDLAAAGNFTPIDFDKMVSEVEISIAKRPKKTKVKGHKRSLPAKREEAPSPRVIKAWSEWSRNILKKMPALEVGMPHELRVFLLGERGQTA
jgi:hypothetical protein